MTLTSVVLLVLKMSIALSVFALGLKATFADVTFLFRRPAQLARAFLSMNVLMPLIAYILVMTFNLNPAVKIALVALAVSPVPPIFPKKAMKRGGEENYTIGLLVAAAILSIAVIPMTMALLDRVTVPVHMSAATVAGLVFMTILTPLLAGIVIRAFVPIAETWADHIGRLANILLVLAVIPVVIASARAIFSLIGDGTLVSFIAFAIVGFVIGHVLGGPEPENRRVLALATATRHPGTAVAIAHLNFPQQQLATPAIALYLIISGIVAALAGRERHPADQAPTQMNQRMAA